jgi:hypothetical protein
MHVCKLSWTGEAGQMERWLTVLENGSRMIPSKRATTAVRQQRTCARTTVWYARAVPSPTHLYSRFSTPTLVGRTEKTDSGGRHRWASGY